MDVFCLQASGSSGTAQVTSLQQVQCPKAESPGFCSSSEMWDHMHTEIASDKQKHDFVIPMTLG